MLFYLKLALSISHASGTRSPFCCPFFARHSHFWQDNYPITGFGTTRNGLRNFLTTYKIMWAFFVISRIRPFKVQTMVVFFWKNLLPKPRGCRTRHQSFSFSVSFTSLSIQVHTISTRNLRRRLSRGQLPAWPVLQTWPSKMWSNVVWKNSNEIWDSYILKKARGNMINFASSPITNQFYAFE